MFDEKDDSLRMKLLELLMGEMDDSVGSRLGKKPEVAEISIDAKPMDDLGDESDMGMMEDPEDKLKRRIEALRK